MKVEVEYYEYECLECCSPSGCMGHETDIPTALWVDDVCFSLGNDDYPMSEDKDTVRKISEVAEKVAAILREKNELQVGDEG